MEEKIKQYVKYQFRFDPREDVESIIDEVSSNLIDRYYERLEKTNDEQKAYIDAIKSMGSFKIKDDIPEVYKVKPDWADIAFILSAILSVFAVIGMFLNAIIGFLFTLTSILLFSAAAYYYYAQAQYARKEELDIEKHHIYLTKIFSYMKTCFIFWTINLSVIFSGIVTGWITFIIASNTMSTGGMTLGGYLFIMFLFFVIGLIIFAMIAKILYDRLILRYRQQTGLNSPHSKIKASIDFLSVNADEKSQDTTLSNMAIAANKAFTVRIMALILGLGLVMTIISPFTIYGRILHENGWYYIDPSAYDKSFYLMQLIKMSMSESFYFVGILGLIGIAQFIIYTLLGLSNKTNIKSLALSFMTWIVLTIIMFFIIEFNDKVGMIPTPGVFAPVFIMIIIALIKLFIILFHPKALIKKEA